MRSTAGGGWTRGAVAVSGLGVLLAGGFAANLAVELQRLAVVWPPIAVFLLGVALSGGLAAGGVWLTRRGFDPAETRQLACWTAAGTAVLVAITAVSVLVRVAEGRAVAEPQIAVLLSGTAGGLAGLVAGHREVLARRKRTEAERARDTMAFLNRTLRHEVLNGVQLVTGHATHLADAVEGDAADSVETITATGEELGELIEDVRLVADVHAGTAELRPIDLADRLRAEAERLADAHPDATVEIDLPEHALARATPAVDHVFRNLLTNAIDHAGEAPTVTVSLDLGDETVSARVADDGPGIPDAEKDGIFEPDAGDTKGFGLHLARTLIEGYDGDLAVEDNAPRGTVFVVTLPRTASAVGIGDPRADGEPGADGAPRAGAPPGSDGDMRAGGDPVSDGGPRAGGGPVDGSGGSTDDGDGEPTDDGDRPPEGDDGPAGHADGSHRDLRTNP